MRATRTIQGLLLAFGAPLGWLALSWLNGRPPWTELVVRPELYLYLTLPTAVTLAIFGRVLGAHEDRLERLVDLLNERALTDPLTGLRNRRYFFDRLEELLERSTRLGRPFALAIVDLDLFKQINDRFGHLAGDRVLRATAAVLAARVRRSELAARIGGEEFGLLLPDACERGSFEAVERIRAALAVEVARESRLPAGVTISASAGVVSSARLPADASASQLIGAADAALYRAKESGRDRTEIWVGRSWTPDDGATHGRSAATCTLSATG